MKALESFVEQSDCMFLNIHCSRASKIRLIVLSKKLKNLDTPADRLQ